MAPNWSLALGLFLLSLTCRVGDFDAMVNTDMYHLWSVRTLRFMRALDSGDYAATYQSHHPGVTLMWLLGLVWRSFGMLSTPIQLHPEKMRIAVWPIAVFASLVCAATFSLLARLLGDARRSTALLASLLLATEPIFLAHSRNPHLDVLATGFAWVSLLTALIAKRENSFGFAVASGTSLGLALMSKISTAGTALGIASVYLLSGLAKPAKTRRLLPLLACIASVAAMVTAILWPALWSAPVSTLTRWHTGLVQETSKAIPFMLFGATGRMVVPGWVYGLYLIFLLTPELLFPGLLLSPFLAKADLSLRRFLVELGVAVAPLIWLVLSANNVGVRNIIQLLPLLATLTAVAITHLGRLLGDRLRHGTGVLCIAVCALLVYRLARPITLYPLPITYCSSWPMVDCSRVFHLGWGEGMREAAKFIESFARLQESGPSGPRVYGSGYVPIVRVWTRATPVKSVDDAELLVDYLPDWQRKGKCSTNIASYVSSHHLTPLYEVSISNRSYVRIYLGPQAARPRGITPRHDDGAAREDPLELDP